MSYKFYENDFKNNLEKFLYFLSDYQERFEQNKFTKRSKVEWICLNEKTKRCKFENLLYNRVLKYQADFGEFSLLLSILNTDKENQKFNLEIIYKDEPDFIYQIPFIADEEIQELLKKLHKDIKKCHYAKMEKFDIFLSNSEQWK